MMHPMAQPSSLRSRVEHAALRLGVFEVLRGVYQSALNRSYRRELQRQQRLFGNFVAPGSLVFDLGANKGEYTAVFVALRAQTVAVEPNPELAERLRQRFRRIEVVESAVGAEEGSATLYLGTDSNYSTISERWKTVTARRNRLSSDSVQVQVTTLDVLIDTFGVPQFVKIDVEGNELPTIRGLTRPIEALVFEYQCPLLDDFRSCCGLLEAIGPYEFGVAREHRIKWGDAHQVAEAIERDCRAGKGSGDVFARLCSQASVAAQPDELTLARPIP